MSGRLAGVRSLRPAVGRALQDWRSRAEGQEAAAVLREVLAEVAPVQGLPAPALWQARRVIRTETDVTVVVLGTDTHGDLAIGRVGPSGDTPSALARNHANLLRVLDDRRLAALHPLLPRPIAQGRHLGRPFALERAIPGRSARDLVGERGPGHVLELGAAAIAPLHTATAAPATITTEAVTEWTTEPLDVLRSAVAGPGGEPPPAVDRLQDRLRGVLEGREGPLGWTHGDLWAGNLLVDGSGRRVVGLVDWDATSVRGWPAVDLVHLVLTTVGQGGRVHFGSLVAGVLRGERLDELSVARDWLPDGADAMAAAVLMTWLQHAGSVLAKQPTHAARAQWLRHNVEPVLHLS